MPLSESDQSTRLFGNEKNGIFLRVGVDVFTGFKEGHQNLAERSGVMDKISLLRHKNPLMVDGGYWETQLDPIGGRIIRLRSNSQGLQLPVDEVGQQAREMTRLVFQELVKDIQFTIDPEFRGFPQ